jgi:hypothetical protein
VTSPATGAETDAPAPAGAAPPEAAAGSVIDDGPVVVPLANSRWRHLVWAVVGLAAGALFFLAFGPLGKVFGLAFAAGGALAGRSFVRTLVQDAGAIRLGPSQIELPLAPCAGTAAPVPLAEVRHAYLLRRATPFFVAGPLLVVETARGAYTYPRDWFHTDADQRRLAAHINRRLGLP